MEACSRPYRNTDGNGVLVLSDADPSMQLFLFAVAADARVAGSAGRMLEDRHAPAGPTHH